MENQSLLQKKLLDGKFIYTAETTPPDASDKEILLKNVIPLKGVADAVNVTDSPGAKAHMSSLTASIILAQNNIDPILQLTVRDRNRLALQGDLIGASALGVNNILCLGGDDPKNGDQPETKAVNDIDSLTLVSTANMMRKEQILPSGRKLEPPPKLFIGGAEVPTQGKPNPDKILNKINNIFDKQPENTSLIIFSDILEKKSKLRNFFEKEKSTVCIPCYLDNARDLELILQSELKEDNIKLSREAINLLIEKSNSDRNNLRNEIEKIKSYSLNKKIIEIDELKSLINFSGDYKSDILINECLCGNIKEYKKIISELYLNTVNQVLLFRIMSNKIQRLLKMKEENSESNNIDSIINSTKPAIFWKEKPLVKKQLTIWSLADLKNIIININNTELMCKKNPQISKSIIFNFFSDICKKASSFS